MSNKRTFLQTRTASNLNLETGAVVMQVQVEDVYYLEAGVSYPPEIIDKISRAL